MNIALRGGAASSPTQDVPTLAHLAPFTFTRKIIPHKHDPGTCVRVKRFGGLCYNMPKEW